MTSVRDTASAPEVDRLLNERVRFAVWFVGAVVLVVAVADSILAPEHLVRLYSLKLVLLAAVALALRALRASGESSRNATIGLFVLALATVFCAASGAILGEVVAPALLILVLCVAVAGAIPWGVWRQLALVVVAGTSLIGVVWTVRGRLDVLLDTPGVAIVGGLAVSIFLAREGARLVEELARANDVRAEFIATMSHELRTPLNVVIGYGQMLTDGAYGPVPDEQRDVLHRIDQSARELHELISTTLDLTRIESGRVSVETCDVDVGRILGEVVAELEPLRPRAVELHCNVSQGLPPLATDPMKLKVIVKNLVRNALKFTDAGSVSIDAYLVDGGVEIRVDDTGIGIGPEFQEQAFEAFRQALPGQDGRGGVGLGLHIVRRLVELLEGSVRLESTLGVGSRFFLLLPRPATPAARSATASTSKA